MSLAIDLFCGLGGWTEGLLSEGWDVIGFDIERHEYGEHRYPGQLVLQDVRTLDGAQFKDAALIVASPPCQAYSYRAMPWTRAKALPPPDNTLFETCFRLQREASEAAGRRVPLIVENVKGAQPWVGRARWNYGSFYLWGDVPALMPITLNGSRKGVGPPRFGSTEGGAHGMKRWTNPAEGFKSTGLDWSNPALRGQDFTPVAGEQAIKNAGGSWFNVAHNTTSDKGRNPDGRALDGVKHHGSGAVWFDTGPAALPSSSPRRKFASAMIAKIPLPLSRYIGRTFLPLEIRSLSDK